MEKHDGGILKLERHDEEAERRHDLRWLEGLTLEERFAVMRERSEAIAWMLIRLGHRKPSEVVKRTRD